MKKEKLYVGVLRTKPQSTIVGQHHVKDDYYLKFYGRDDDELIERLFYLLRKYKNYVFRDSFDVFEMDSIEHNGENYVNIDILYSGGLYHGYQVDAYTRLSTKVNFVKYVRMEDVKKTPLWLALSLLPRGD